MVTIVKEQQEVFILLLGQTGVGKTCTINSFAQILAYSTLDEAMKYKEPIVLVPLKYTENYNDGTSEDISYMGAQIADAANEQTDNTALSCTQKPRMYSFKCAEKTFNFIDMPGFGDTSGEGQDEMHKRQRYAFLQQIPQLHAIVTVVHASQNNLAPQFVAALDDIMTMVPRIGVQNLLFFMTHGMTSRFNGSAIQGPLTEYLHKINARYNVELSFENNAFMVDHFGFLHLLSYCKSMKYFNLKSAANQSNAELCWEETKKAFYAMTRKVLQLPGIPTSEIQAVNSARHFIETVVTVITKINAEVKEFDNPQNQAAIAQKARTNNPRGTRGKTDKELKDEEVTKFKKQLHTEIFAVANALKKPAGYLKHHSVAILSNSFQTRLEQDIRHLEVLAEFQAANDLRVQLQNKNIQHESIEFIIKNADKNCTYREVQSVPAELCKLSIIGDRLIEEYKEFKAVNTFQFQDTVKYKAKYPIQQQV